MMDYTTLLMTANHNKKQAEREKQTQPVLKTKLGGPKKEERKKVDVSVIKQRVEAQRNPGKKPEKNTKISSKQRPLDSGEHKSQTGSKHTALPVNNLEFIANIRKLNEMAEKKAKAPLIRPAPAKEAPPTKGAPVAGTKPKSKSKPAANPPKFSDLIAMAQKVQTDPNALKTIKPTKPSTSKDNADISKPPQKGQTKPSKTIQQTAPLKANKDSSVASKKTNSQQSAKGNPPISDKGNPRKRPPQYRSCDQGPPVKQTLSEASLAKLALKNGKAPMRSQPQSTKTASSIAASSSVSKKELRLPSKDKSNTIGDNKGKKSQTQPEPKPSSNPASTGSTWDRLMGSKSQKTKEKKLARARRYIDSDESDDGEDMDGFIDDGDEEIDQEFDMRNVLKDVFRYDSTKYRDEEDFDDRTMVAGFSDIMKEEVRSSKLAMKEDMEQMRLEEEARKRKMSKKKK